MITFDKIKYMANNSHKLLTVNMEVETNKGKDDRLALNDFFASYYLSWPTGCSHAGALT